MSSPGAAQNWLRRLSAVLACALGLALVATPALSFEILGMKFFEREEPADTIGEPQSYAVVFVVEGEDRDIEKALKGASSLWGDRDEPASGAAGLLAKARGDYRRVLAALYAQARYGGTISIMVDGREADDIPVDAVFPDPVQVRVAIDPGPLFRFDQAEIVNEAPLPLRRGDRVDRPEDEGFLPGEPAFSTTVLKAERLAVDAWREQGHARAEVVERVVVAEHDSNTIDARLLVEPGRIAYYGDVSVEGTERMEPGFVAWMTGLKRGEEYDPDHIEEAGDRLTRLEVFRAMRIQEAEEIGPDGELPIQVVLQERLPRRFGVGGSYSTLDGLGLEAFWLHRNLFGRAERLRIEGKVAGIGETVDPEDLTYRLATMFTRPGVSTPDTDFIASIVGDREVLESYTRTGVSGEAGFRHMFTKELSARAFAQGGYAQFEDEVFGTRDFVTAGVHGALTYDSRDNPADATRGIFAEAIVEPYYEFNYGNTAIRATAEGRTYYGLGEENRIVLAGRAKIGSLVGAPISETPPDKLFFAGGGGSVRGYAYRNIGVPSGTDDVTGGRSLIEGSFEVRGRVTESIDLVGFIDAGYVGAESFPDFSEDLRVGVGAGLRYQTGLGPIRLDVAVPLDPRPGDPDVAFYVGIGQAF